MTCPLSSAAVPHVQSVQPLRSVPTPLSHFEKRNKFLAEHLRQVLDNSGSPATHRCRKMFDTKIGGAESKDETR
jgi:hypothetical protein